jgi:hypothetical protein
VAFPQTPQPVLVELKVGSTDWANVTSKVLQRDNPKPITISRGSSDPSSLTQPAECTFEINNRAGTFSPRNPTSLLYGQIGRNTPVRVSIGRGAYGMVIANNSTGRVEAGDTAGTSITGDLDVAVDAETLDLTATTGGSLNWTTGGFDLCSKFDNTDAARSWSFIVVGGKLQLHWFTAGTVASAKLAESTVTIPAPGVGRRALRATLDVDNGAAGWTVTFYTAATISGTWTQLGAPVTQAGVTSIFDGTGLTRVGSNPVTTTYTHGHTGPCVFYKAEIKAGIAGALRASPDFTVQPLDPIPFGTSNFADAQGNNWFFSGFADEARTWYGDVDTRFYGEIAELPPEWDTSGRDSWVSIKANGLLRRLAQGTDAAETGLRNFIYPKPNLWRYWPLSGASGTTYSLDIAPMWGGPTNFRFYSEAPGGVGNFGYGTDMGPYLGTGMAFFNSTSGPMRGDVSTGDPNWAVDFVFSTVTSTGGMGSFTLVCPGYDGIQWELNFNAGVAQVKWNDTINAPTVYPATSVLPALQDLGPHHVRFQVTESVTQAAQWTLFIDGVQIATGTQNGYFQTGLGVIRFYMTRAAGQERINLAHIAIWSFPTALPGPLPAVPDWPTAAAASAAASGYLGEAAGTRINRIVTLAGYQLLAVGDLTQTQAMGPQYSESMMTQIREAEATDLGILTEPRDRPGLLYRTHKSLYNQTPGVTLNVSAGQVAPPFKLVDDDVATRNDITVVRREGDSVRLTQTTGILNVSEPPAGVGRYRDEIQVNVQADAYLQPVASWLLHMGTFDDPRMPSLSVNLSNPDIVSAGLGQQVRNLEIGSLIVLTAISAHYLPDDLKLLVQGYKEWLGPRIHEFEFNCSPGALFDVAVYGSGVGTGPDRYDTAGSQLVAAVTSTATSFTVQPSAGSSTLWTNVAGEFPFDIKVGGERMRVTNITSATSPQTFTVTRSINGVVKAQPAGAAVTLWKTPRYAL